MDSTDDPSRLWSSGELRNPHAHSDKSRKVQAMFNAIAPRYELANTLLSFGRDRRWRQVLVRRIGARGVEPKDVLDLACGTGSTARVLARAFPKARVVGVDFAEAMLRRAHGPFSRAAADALTLPFGDGQFDLVTCTFGLRNFQSLETGLREIGRVLKPGGLLAVLDFQPPSSKVLGRVFQFYFSRILPLLGSLIASGGQTRAYHYLPRSVATWCSAKDLAGTMGHIGFDGFEETPMCFSAVRAMIAEKSRNGSAGR